MQQLQLWMDDVARSGPDNMARDEQMMATVELPTLRVYRWASNWASYGYFGNEMAAKSALAQSRRWVRRPTGGGVVDHAADWTYTLAIPASHELAQRRGVASYQVIHQALCHALNQEDCGEFALAVNPFSPNQLACFVAPVKYDIVDATGCKWAGAGQRRFRHGLLHQGSVARRPLNGQPRAQRLAQQLATEVIDIQPD